MNSSCIIGQSIGGSASLRSSNSSSSSSRRWQHFVAVVAFLGLMLPCRTVAFSVSMSYKPPVKSSVGKLRSTQRQSRTATRPTSKSAYAGALTPPSAPTVPSPRSFEKRMRDLVLGSPQPKVAATKAPVRKLPANVMTVETLQEFKKAVVGQDKMVAVRFHASWCKVS
jgi:hypothetical protein